MSIDENTLKEWIETVREDVKALSRVLATAAAPRETRKAAAAGLSYLVSRMDLVPDWEPAIGVVDDVFVLRVCARLARSHGLDGLSDASKLELERLANQAAHVETFLGADLYTRFRAYCQTLSETTVRGRTPQSLLDDDKARVQLGRELETDIARIPAVSLPSIAIKDVRVKLLAHLEHRLK